MSNKDIPTQVRTVVVKLRGITPLQQCKEYASYTPKKGSETPQAFEKRTWKERVHKDDDGNILLPHGAFKHAIVAGAKFSGKKVPGRGNTQYAKFFQSAVAVDVNEPILTGNTTKDIVETAVFCTADGTRDGGSKGKKRVWKYFPTFMKWECEVTLLVMTEIITEEIFEETLIDTGRYIGVGTWRPENGGSNGRFVVESLKWN